MKALARLVCAVAAAVLAGCGPIYETQYQFTPPPDPQGKMCAVQCQQNQTYCRANCDMARQACLAYEHDRGMEAYERYAYERHRARQPVKRTPDSFVEKYRCSNSCEEGCADEYRQCFGICGGTVTSQQVCTFNCELPPLPPPPFPSAEPPPPPGTPLCVKGAFVQAYTGNDWRSAVVKAAPLPDGRCPVHYDGQSSKNDENVLPAMLRPRG
jgi:hypothetical protein